MLGQRLATNDGKSKRANKKSESFYDILYKSFVYETVFRTTTYFIIWILLAWCIYSINTTAYCTDNQCAFKIHGIASLVTSIPLTYACMCLLDDIIMQFISATCAFFIEHKN